MPATDKGLQAVLASLGVAVLERGNAGTFRSLTEPAEWFSLVFSAESLTEETLGERSPFLDAFFETARPFWSRGETGRIRSGPWVETDSSGQEHRLEASAFCLDARQLLVVESANRAAPGMDQVLQKAREASLANESLTKRVRAGETRQRVIAFDMNEACRGIEKLLDALNPGQLSQNELHYLEIGRRQVQRLRELIRELGGETADSSR